MMFALKLKDCLNHIIPSCCVAKAEAAPCLMLAQRCLGHQDESKSSQCSSSPCCSPSASEEAEI